MGYPHPDPTGEAGPKQRLVSPQPPQRWEWGGDAAAHRVPRPALPCRDAPRSSARPAAPHTSRRHGPQKHRQEGPHGTAEAHTGQHSPAHDPRAAAASGTPNPPGRAGSHSAQRPRSARPPPPPLSPTGQGRPQEPPAPQPPRSRPAPGRVSVRTRPPPHPEPPRLLTPGIERGAVLPSGPGASHTAGRGARGGQEGAAAARSGGARDGDGLRAARCGPAGGDTREPPRRHRAPRAQAAPSPPCPVVRPARR